MVKEETLINDAKRYTKESFEFLKNERNRKLGYEMLTFFGMVRAGAELYLHSIDLYEQILESNTKSCTEASVGDTLIQQVTPPAWRSFWMGRKLAGGKK